MSDKRYNAMITGVGMYAPEKILDNNNESNSTLNFKHKKNKYYKINYYEKKIFTLRSGIFNVA